MPKLRAAVADPAVSAFSHGPLTVAVLQEGKARFVEVDLLDVPAEPDEDKAAAEAGNALAEQGLRALASHHQLGEPELVPDKPKPAAKAEPAEKE